MRVCTDPQRRVHRRACQGRLGEIAACRDNAGRLFLAYFLREAEFSARLLPQFLDGGSFGSAFGRLYMSLTHRFVTEQDIQRICSFPQSEDELFFLFPKASFPLLPAQLQEAIAQRSDSTVVELDGEVVAFANFYRREVGACCSIGNVIVSPAARGRGVGRYLIGQMIALAFSKHQAAEVSVSCFSQNVAGLLLYPKLGFQPYAVEERKDNKGNRVALVHMRLPRNAA